MVYLQLSGIMLSGCIHVFPPYFLQGAVNNHSQQMVQGLLGLMTLCPQEVAHLRKELLMAARHILSTDLRNREFVL